ncbi:MAG: hypothetical protein V4764_00920 [Burkholderia sp.]
MSSIVNFDQGVLGQAAMMNALREGRSTLELMGLTSWRASQ